MSKFRRGLLGICALSLQLAINMNTFKKPSLFKSVSKTGGPLKSGAKLKHLPKTRDSMKYDRLGALIKTGARTATAAQNVKIVEMINELSLKSFLELFQPSSALVLPSESKTAKNEGIKLHFEDAKSLSAPDLEACFNLIEQTSKDDYRTSGHGWRPARKRNEMRLPDLKYLLVKGLPSHPARTNSASSSKDRASDVKGFMSFMLTYEDGKEVVYCYEIHLAEVFRGSGLGKHLMEVLEETGRNAGVEKAMLTVFKKNKGAIQFYRRLGYEIDEYSPQPKLLRSGKVKESSYVILSKSLRADVNGEDEGDVLGEDL